MALLMFLLACQGPDLPVAPSCAHDVDDWYGGMSRHAQRRDASGGFDYQADEAWVTGHDGSWDRHGGSFTLTTLYAQDYFLASEWAVGVASFAPSGDYQVSWTQLTTDSLGDQSQIDLHEQRSGCAVEREARSGGELVYSELEILDGRTVQGFITSSASDFDVSATWRDDNSASLDYAGHDGESWYEMEEPGDGTLQATYHLVYSGGTEDGGYERAFDGAREYQFDRYPDEGDWAVLHIWWLLNYDGSGEGEVLGVGHDGSTLTCWYSWDSDGVGSYSCDDGTSGPY